MTATTAQAAAIRRLCNANPRCVILARPYPRYDPAILIEAVSDTGRGCRLVHPDGTHTPGPLRSRRRI